MAVKLAVCDPDPVLAGEIREFLPPSEIDVRKTISDWQEARDVLADGSVTVALFGPGWSTAQTTQAVASAIEAGSKVGVVLLTREYTQELASACREAGLAGILPVPVDASDLLFAIKKASDMPAAPALKKRRGTGLGRTVALFSTKGGVGKSVLATNLAAGLAVGRGRSLRLLDLDLQFGDAAVMLGLKPRRTIHDLVGIELKDFELDTVLTRYGENLDVLVAPLQPELADLVPADIVVPLVKRMAAGVEWLVIDTPPTFNDHVLAALEAVDELLLVVNPDMPSIKNSKLCLKTLGLLKFDPRKVKVILNKSDGGGGLRGADVERALGMKVAAAVPRDEQVVRAVNKGVPIVLDNPEAPAARAIESICYMLSADRSQRRKEA